MRNSIIGIATGLAAMLSPVLAAAQVCDIAAGEKIFARCKACHKVEEGARGVGPHLSGVVGRPVAGVEDYAYSDALKEYAGGDLVWDQSRLSEWLENPRALVPGTRMTFAGLPKADRRADVICYLETLE